VSVTHCFNMKQRFHYINTAIQLVLGVCNTFPTTQNCVTNSFWKINFSLLAWQAVSATLT
jgi:hypothetical protein